MKVLMVTTGMDIGGAETHITELCRAFTERGLSVTVASSGGVFVSTLLKNGISHVTLPLDQKTPSALAVSYKGLEDLIRREKFDIVHAHARLPAFLCGQLRKKYGFRFVTTDHLDFRVTPLLKKLTDWGELTFAVSEDLHGYLIKNYNLYGLPKCRGWLEYRQSNRMSKHLLAIRFPDIPCFESGTSLLMEQIRYVS